jgi:hypothetical protein
MSIHTLTIICCISLSDKLVVKDGREWCLDVLDKFVVCGQSVNVGEAVLRRYKPVSTDHNHIVLGIFSSDSDKAEVRSLLIWVQWIMMYKYAFF